jgi:hypothetical protein
LRGSDTGFVQRAFTDATNAARSLEMAGTSFADSDRQNALRSRADCQVSRREMFVRARSGKLQNRKSRDHAGRDERVRKRLEPLEPKLAPGLKYRFSADGLRL